MPSTAYDTIMISGTSASPSGSSLHSPFSHFLASTQSGHFVIFLGGAQAITSSCVCFPTPCSLFASSFSFWYIHKSCFFSAICKTSSVFVLSKFLYFFNDLILQSFTRSVLHSGLAFDHILDLSFVQHLYFTTYVLTPPFQVDWAFPPRFPSGPASNK